MIRTYSVAELSQKARTQFSSSETLSAIKQDLEDTYSKQTAALGVLLDLQSSTHEDITLICNELPITVPFNGSLVELTFDPDGEMIEVYQALDTRLEKISDIDIAPVISGDKAFSELEASVTLLNGSVCDLNGNIAAYVSESATQTELLINYANVAINTMEDGADITNRLHAVNDTLTQASSTSTQALAAQIEGAVAQCGGQKGSVISVLQQIYSGITNTNINDTTGEIEFANTDYTVQGFAYSHVLGTLVTAANTVLSAVLTVVNPIIGIVAGAVGNFLSALFSASYIEGDTYPRVNVQSDNKLFCVPVMQGTVEAADIAVSGLYTADELLSFINNAGGVVTLKYFFGDLLLWVNSSRPTQINYECYLQVKKSLNIGYNTFKTNLHLTVNAGGSITYDHKMDIFDSLTTHTSHLVDTGIGCMLANAQYVGNQPDSAVPSELSPYTYIAILQEGIGSIIKITMGAYLENVYPDDDPNASSDENLAWCLYYTIGPGAGASGHGDYSELVNDVIPLVRKRLSDADHFSKLLRNWFEYQQRAFSTGVDWIGNLEAALLSNAAELTYDGPYNLTAPIYYLPDRGKFFLYPPKYSSSAVRTTQLITIGIAMATTGFIIAKTVIGVKMKSVMAKKYLEVAANQAKYTEDPSEENWKKYWKSLKRYNLFAGFTGYSKLSLISGWELGDDTGLAGSDINTNLSQMISDKLGAIQGDTVTEEAVPVSLEELAHLIR